VEFTTVTRVPSSGCSSVIGSKPRRGVTGIRRLTHKSKRLSKNFAEQLEQLSAEEQKPVMRVFTFHEARFGFSARVPGAFAVNPAIPSSATSPLPFSFHRKGSSGRI
jgi:hypothetical protein